MSVACEPAGSPLRSRWVETALGRWLVAVSDAGLCYLGLDAERASSDLQRWARRALPAAEIVEVETRATSEVSRQLCEYAAGRRRRFELPLDLHGTDFQLAVWRALVAIPFGRTCTYGELAVRIGRPAATRAVGSAAGRNPVPLVVPCHRLVAATGLGGFSAGLGRKRSLLALEGVLPCASPELPFEFSADR